MGTLGEARGTVGAWRAVAVRVRRLGLLALRWMKPSASEELAVLGRDVVVLKEGRRSDVKDGEGGRGVGGRL